MQTMYGGALLIRTTLEVGKIMETFGFESIVRCFTLLPSFRRHFVQNMLRWARSADE